eukprot:CAMPEP_0182933498 /NCGR_PEP_ID=MMETSP0105_2-20130417/33970_1 /TAXON_ID=81532 ORGANISM="Acanthoeca-like sp., Strain 10tr" /NCGR_SAMPLE_ID=MMETSP0105_2 /ASSEMBLY_ACC=CAM_ASM_000205 /LENGTH=159 /DNA_ID=CAMNT_0025072239 /DNA_START=93 /DNA_END=572 /DNA_ORIENTATION=+
MMRAGPHSRTTVTTSVVPRLGVHPHLRHAPRGPVPQPSVSRLTAARHASTLWTVGAESMGRLAVPAAVPAFRSTRGFKSKKRMLQIARQRLQPEKPKMKTKKAVSKRVRRIANGGLKHWHSNRSHNSSSKSKKHRRQTRRTGIIKGNLLKVLNKMLVNR